MPDLTQFLATLKANWPVVAIALAVLAFANKDTLLGWAKGLLPGTAAPATPPTDEPEASFAAIAHLRDIAGAHGETEAVDALDKVVAPAIIKHAYDK